ncbi:hypothetical protein [Aquibacillus sediminis]|uniref:hypothetical protein n=1 Tax=Aquibacillus sediminis TaxID=2574734 RepID=UPI001109EDA6|nr:hypothetical protein [Aquibacillus sediminis]
MKHKKTIGMLIAVVVIVIFSTIQYLENKNYEDYLSLELLNHMSKFSSSTIINGYMLDEVIAEEEITMTQLENMKDKYEQMRKHGGKMVDMARSFNKIDTSDYNIHPYPVYLASDFHYFIRRMTPEDEEVEVIELTDEKLEQFTMMKKVNDVWVDALAENIKGIHIPKSNMVDTQYGVVKGEQTPPTKDEYFDTYREGTIHNKDWIRVIEQMQEGIYEFEREINLIFND